VKDYEPIPRILNSEEMPPTHGVLCVPCGWHASDGAHACTKSRLVKFRTMYGLFRELYGETPIAIILAGDLYQRTVLSAGPPLRTQPEPMPWPAGPLDFDEEE